MLAQNKVTTEETNRDPVSECRMKAVYLSLFWSAKK
jgi:hypothetical protein